MTQDINFGQEINEAIDEAMKQRGFVNILLAGKTGVGKSTLINAVFQGNFAETGQGEPVTLNTRKVVKDGSPVSLYDTRGLELKDFDETMAQLKKLVLELKSKDDPSVHIHVAWVCIAEDTRRVENAEISLVNMLSDHMPVIVVITKALSDNGFRNKVQSLVPKSKNVIRVLAMEQKFDDGHVVPAWNLQSLVELTMEVVPEGQRFAFAAAQKVSIQLKAKQSHIVVAKWASASVAVGMTPIPFSDMFLLAPIQIKMLASISGIFGFNVTETFLITILSGFSGVSGATYIGRNIAANLLKLVPGAGLLAGGVISGATAGVVTTMLGEIYITVLTRLFEENNGEPPNPQVAVRVFNEQIAAATAGILR